MSSDGARALASSVIVDLLAGHITADKATALVRAMQNGPMHATLVDVPLVRQLYQPGGTILFADPATARAFAVNDPSRFLVRRAPLP